MREYDNRVENLQWVSKKENQIHAWINNRKKPLIGCNNPMAILNDDIVRKIRQEYIPYKNSYKKLAKKYNVGIASIGYAIRNQTWKHI